MQKRAQRAPLVVGGVGFVPGTTGEVEVDAGHSYAGERVRVPVRIVRGRHAGPRLALIAGLRGDELSAIQAVRETLLRLDPELLGGDVLAVPLAHVAGFVQAGGVAAERLRLDRNFPGDARGTAAARHARGLFLEVVRNAELVIVLSSSPRTRRAIAHVRVSLDHPAAVRLAAAFGAPVVLHDPGTMGSLALAATESGLPAIVFEVGSVREIDRDAIESTVAQVLSVCRAYRMIRGGVPLSVRQTIVREAEWLRASAGGLVELHVQAGQLVRAGEPVADIISPLGGERHIETAPEAGLVLATTTRAVAMAGTPLLHLGRDVRRAPSAARVGPPTTRQLGSRTLIGWAEWVGLPDLGVPRLKAKIDSGARTCALHVTSMRKVGEDDQGQTILEIKVPTTRARRAAGAADVAVRTVLLDTVTVRDSGGHAERRPAIETTLQIGSMARRVRVTLTYRGDMLFPMLVGRTALGNEFLVDVGAQYLLGRKPKG